MDKWNILAARIASIAPIAYIHSCIARVYKLQISLYLSAPILQSMVAVRLVEISSCSAVNCKSVYIIIILMATHTRTGAILYSPTACFRIMIWNSPVHKLSITHLYIIIIEDKHYKSN